MPALVPCQLGDVARLCRRLTSSTAFSFGAASAQTSACPVTKKQNHIGQTCTITSCRQAESASVHNTCKSTPDGDDRLLATACSLFPPLKVKK